MAKKKRKKIDTWKTKKWYTVLAPPSFDEKELGETPAPDAQTLTGRTIRVNLGELTGQRAKQYVGLKFQVTDVKRDKAYTSIQGHELQRGYVGRQLRRMRTLVNCVFNVTTKDDKKIQVQVMAFGKTRADEKQEKEARKRIEETMKEKAKKTNFEQLFQEIVFSKLSTQVFSQAKKIFPFSRAEITKTKLLEEK